MIHKTMNAAVWAAAMPVAVFADGAAKASGNVNVHVVAASSNAVKASLN